MEKSKVSEMIVVIRTEYFYHLNGMTEDQLKQKVEIWFESLRDYGDEEVLKAFRICLLKCKAPPTIADLVEKIEKARDLKRPSKAEVWERVLKAVDKTKKQVYSEQWGYRPLYKYKNDECKKIFHELPESVKKWLGFDAFCSYGEMSTTSLNVERARFMKEIDEIRETIREMRQISTNELLLPSGQAIIGG